MSSSSRPEEREETSLREREDFLGVATPSSEEEWRRRVKLEGEAARGSEDVVTATATGAAVVVPAVVVVASVPAVGLPEVPLKEPG
jgi:uncharacterized protein (DUF1684 family)